MESWKWRKNACNMIMRTKIGYLDGMPRPRSFDKPGIRRNKSFTTQQSKYFSQYKFINYLNKKLFNATKS